jgi:hypothetical protein
VKRTQQILRVWLVLAGCAFAVLGIAMAVASDTSLFRAIFGSLIDSAFWSDQVPAEARPCQIWVYGAWGGTAAGFGLLIVVVAPEAVKPARQRLRLGMLAALVLWFVVDTGASIASGVWGNALAVNVPGFVVLALPLLLADVHGRREHAG